MQITLHENHITNTHNLIHHSYSNHIRNMIPMFCYHSSKCLEKMQDVFSSVWDNLIAHINVAYLFLTLNMLH